MYWRKGLKEESLSPQSLRVSLSNDFAGRYEANSAGPLRQV
jgi:hypothetical protein